MLRLALAAAALALPAVGAAEPVLLISIDGLRPGDVIEAEKRGLAIPNLRRFVREGSYASGVIGVLPTVTYPSHATLLTGASPARHGIVGNTSFDPLQINQSGWYWYAADIKLPTLWEAAAKAGLTTANVHWPVSVGAASIRWNLPQIWRTGHDDDRKLLNVLATPGLVDRLEKELGRYAPGIDESIGGDETRGRFAARLIARERPGFATVYLTALDHEQHEFGPGTPQAHAVLERIDAIVGTLIGAARAADPATTIAVVSDHGFSPTDTEINLFRAFIDAGLIGLDAQGKVTDWQAMPWPSGGSIAVVLARPSDTALEARVAGVLDRLKAHRANRIAAVARRRAVSAMGANPTAAFYIDLEPGALAGGFKGASAALVSSSKTRGTHGYFPAGPLMRSTFMIMGRDVASGRDLGTIDMRAIAPTLAAILGVPLPDAELPALALSQK